MRIKLKHQLNLMFLIIGFFILTVSSTMIYYQIMNILEDKSEQSTVLLFRQMEKGILSFRQAVEQNSVELLLDPRVKNFLLNNNSDVDHLFEGLELGKLFKKVIVQNRYFASILLFSENGEIVGESNSRTRFLRDRRDQPFYASEMYRISSEQSFGMFWFGGKSTKDFITSDLFDSRDPQLISTVRYIEIPQNHKQGGVLVLNIKEGELASLYSSLSDLEGTHSYILDELGVVISSQEKEDLGKKSTVFSQLNPENRFGSISYSDENSDRKQVVYYYLENSDWILVKEIPIKLLNRDLVKLQRILIVALVSSLMLMILFSNYWTQLILTPLKELANKMQKLERGQLGILVDELPKNEIGLLGRQFNRMSKSFVELIKHNEIIERKKRDYEVKALQAQISPHFLYNTLNSIKWMAISRKAQNIVDSVVALGNMLQPFYKYTSLFCSLQDEVNYIINYVMLMNQRYGEGIQLKIDLPEHLRETNTLKFILQPIVENAIQHGFEQKQFKGEISITVLEQNGDLMILVADDGTGISEDKLKEIRLSLSTEYVEENTHQSIGLQNTHHRIQLHFGMEYGISLHSPSGLGTIVELRLPIVGASL